MTGYEVKILESSMELSAKQRIAMKDTSNAIKLDEATETDSVVIRPTGWVTLGIHNEKSENKDYEVYLIVDDNNNKYITGSESFFTSFMDIYNEMENEDEEWLLNIYKLDSKNYKGKKFITCSII